MFFKVLGAIVAADAFRSHREEQEREAWVAAWQRAVATVPPPPAAPSPQAHGAPLLDAPERPW